MSIKGRRRARRNAAGRAREAAEKVALGKQPKATRTPKERTPEQVAEHRAMARSAANWLFPDCD